MDTATKAAIGAGVYAMFDALCTPPNNKHDDDDDEIAAIAAVIDSGPDDEVLPLYLGDSFKEHFRLSKTTAMVIVNMLSGATRSTGRPPISTEKHVLSSLWLLANLESYRSVGDRFGMAKSQLHRSVSSFCTQMFELRGDFIKWPEDTETMKCVEEFNALRGPLSFPGVIGCVDALHINIAKVTNDDAVSYCNRKGSYSVILQAICDANMRFIDTFAGWPGSSEDSHVWKNSPIYNMFKESPIAEDVHLLADCAYPLATYLMVPYKDDRIMSERQKLFNQKLSATRVVIDEAFRLLKNRFRRLHRLEVKDLTLLPRIITACCALHNICIASGDTVLSDPDADFEYGDDFSDEDIVVGLNVKNMSTAIVKRDILAEQLYNET